MRDEGPTDREFEYDVAFSFSAKDEGLATELNDLLKERFKTFIYTEKQKVLAGTDGEKTFNEVFMQKARVVVIFYRSEYGETPFTRIELTAIRNRAHEEGYDFTLWIPTEDGARLPAYVGKNRLYFSLKRYGVSGAAAVVEECIQRMGGNTRPESLVEKAERLKKQKEAQEKRLAFLRSGEGIQAAALSAKRLISALGSRASELVNWNFKVETYLEEKKMDNWVEVVASSRVLSVTWHQPYLNDLEDAGLLVQIWGALPPRPNRRYWRGEEPSALKTEKFDYDRTLVEAEVWTRTSDAKQFDEGALIDHAIGLLLDAINKAVMSEKPRR